MFGIQSEIFQAFTLVIIGSIVFVCAFVPLKIILPQGLHDLIPRFLENDSLAIYLQSHLLFFIQIVPFAVFLAIAIILWRRR